MVRQEKIQKAKELKELTQKSKTVGVIDFSKLPGKAQLSIKNELKKHGVSIRMARKGVIAKSLEEAGKNFKDLEPLLKGSPALIFADIDAFKLFQLIKKNKSTSPAKAGDVVGKDVVAKKGPTGIAPGPAISTLGKVGLKTRVEGGKIAIADDKVIVKAGAAVTEDAAVVLSMLKLEPMEIVMNMVSAWDDGTIYSKEILDVDAEAYVRMIGAAVQAGVNLSLNTGFITKFTAPLAIQKAFWDARALVMEANIFEKEMIGDVLAKAAAQAKALQEKVLK